MREATLDVLRHTTQACDIDDIAGELGPYLQACLQNDTTQVYAVLPAVAEDHPDAALPIARTVLTNLDAESPATAGSALLGLAHLLPEIRSNR